MSLQIKALTRSLHVLMMLCLIMMIIVMEGNFISSELLLNNDKFRIRDDHENVLNYMRRKALSSWENDDQMMMENSNQILLNDSDASGVVISNNSSTIPNIFYLNTNIPTINNASSLNCNNISNPCTKGSQILNYFYENLVYKTDSIDVYVIGNLTDCFDGTDRSNSSTSNLLTMRLIGQDPNQYSYMNCNMRLLFTNVYFHYFNLYKYDVKNLNTVGFVNCNINSVNGDEKIETGKLVIRNSISRNSNFETTSVVDIDKFVMIESDLKVFFHDLYFWKSRFLTVNTLNNSLFVDSSIELNRLSMVAVENSRFERSQLTAVYLSALEINNCTVYETVRWLRLKGTILLSLENSVISESPYDSSSKGIIESILSSYIHINQCKFLSNNNIAVYVDETGFFHTRKSLFSNNLGAVYIGEIVNLGDVLTGVHIISSTFSRNFGVNGGAITLPNTTSEIFRCEFYANIAQAGGAIFSTSGELNILNSIFEENHAFYSPSCPTPFCGRGGAIYAQNPILLNIDSKNTFRRNYARDGGAIYVDIYDDNEFWKSWILVLNCLENSATFYGDCFYSKQDMKEHDFLKILKNSPNALGSSKLTIVDVKPSSLEVYPGQKASIALTIMDGFNNTLQKLQTQPVIASSDPGVAFQTFFENTTFTISLQVTNHNTTSAVASFYVGEANVNITVKIIPCPDGYSLVNYSASETSKRLCLKNPDPPLHIILPAIFSSIILFIVGILLGILIIYLGWNINEKLKRLKKKEKAEKNLAQRLVDKQVIFSENNELNPSTDLKTSLLGSYYANSQGSSSSGKNRKIKEKIRMQAEQNYLIPIENIDIVRKIAEGANGIVYLGKWLGTEVAMKSLKLEYVTEEENEEFEKEAALLKSLKHPNIVTSFGVCMSGNIKYMIVEYMPRGSLDRAIYQSRTGAQILKLKQKVNILLGVANGMNYLHSLKPYSIIHRDLKPGNILLDHNLSSKVTDFGLSKIIGGNSTNTMTTALGTLFYMR
ncbi:predicted protein [Naegleria gruberi]|uniref:non-specific serine/threonine protein kinase n=1 Tax=Naegleria gruberi TaxID=5762 RepID=D2V8F7_NAEGR|nr:uncharacterized protein NAEGRDRAFT_65139 [Naegleria gruberi]EFC46676.1 predicted protein [Naegleria gruberi]|eukprot:XP_002679420.1 predicted protein [Naegleria gruberi strain NEG-M]